MNKNIVNDKTIKEYLKNNEIYEIEKWYNSTN